MKVTFYRSVAEFAAKRHPLQKFIDLDLMKRTGSEFNSYEIIRFVGFAGACSQLTKRTTS